MSDDLSAWNLHDEFTLHEAVSLVVGVDPYGFYNARDAAGYYTVEKALVTALYKGYLQAVSKSDFNNSTVEELVTRGLFDWKKEGEEIAITKMDIACWLQGKGFSSAFFCLHPQKEHCQDLKEKEIDPRKEVTLHILLAHFAGNSGYSLDDKNAVGKVKRALELKGIEVSDKTIRNNMKDSFETFNDKRK